MDAVASRIGVVNAATPSNWTEENALFAELYLTEVMAAFDETNVFMERHRVRDIDHGKSANFPATWKATAGYHTPGTQIVGSNRFKHNQRTINVDDKLISDVFIADIDEAKNHYDVRQEYSKQMGAALAREADQKLAVVGVLTARASATISGGVGGSTLTNSAFKTDGEVLAGGIFAAAQTFDEKDVPEMGRMVAVLPAQYYLMAQTTKLLNRDWGGSGVYADGSILKVADIEIVKTNNLPTTNISSSTAGEQNTYTGNFTNTAALVWTRDAFGTVRLMQLRLQMTGEELAAIYQGHFMVASYAMGHGILRPECAIELATS